MSVWRRASLPIKIKKYNMEKLQLLNSLQDLILLRDLYQRDLERTRHGFDTLSNFIRWFQLDPQLDFVRVYVIDNTWREKGFFIIQDRYQLFINCVIYDETEVEAALKSWKWERQYKIKALPAVLLNIVKKVLYDHSVQYKMATLNIYQRDIKDTSQNTLECPEAFEIRPLTLSDAETVDNEWHSQQDGSLDFLKCLIKYNISLGIYSKNSNELMAWCTRCQCGFMGTLYVQEQYRRQGLASLLINEFSRRISIEGDKVRVMINEMNQSSINVYTKHQFLHCEKVFILFCEPSNLTIN